MLEGGLAGVGGRPDDIALGQDALDGAAVAGHNERTDPAFAELAHGIAQRRGLRDRLDRVALASEDRLHVHLEPPSHVVSGGIPIPPVAMKIVRS
jgi:hypothetical protein